MRARFKELSVLLTRILPAWLQVEHDVRSFEFLAVACKEELLGLPFLERERAFVLNLYLSGAILPFGNDYLKVRVRE